MTGEIMQALRMAIQQIAEFSCLVSNTSIVNRPIHNEMLCQQPKGVLMSFYLFNELFMKNCCQSEFIVENKYLRSPRKRKLFFFQSSLLGVSNLKPFGRVIMPLGKLQKNLITFMFPLLFISTKNLCKYHQLECSSSDL